MGKKKGAPEKHEPIEPNLEQHFWNNGWGMAMAAMTYAPRLPDGSLPASQGFKIWFEEPRFGWLYPHVSLIGSGEFVCRASDVQNDFLLDLIDALLGVLEGQPSVEAEAFGEPLSFIFRFSSLEAGVRCELVTCNKIVSSEEEETILILGSTGDEICRGFCFGIRELSQNVDPAEYEKAYGHPFPTVKLKMLCEKLGGEFAETDS